MPYAEYPPSPRLAAFVRCVWTFEAEGGTDQPERIVPDARPELIIHYGAPYRESGVEQPRALFAGQLTRPLWLRTGGRAGVVGVRFRPAGARGFLRRPLSAVNDARVPLEEICPGEARALVDAISAAPDAAARVAAAERFVAARIAGDEGDPLVSRCVEWIEERGGLFAIDELAEEAGIGRRQIERRFRDATGISPRLLGNILRIRRVFDELDHGSARAWTDAAMQAGYFDQSHFIREFRRFVGCTPTEFLDSREGLAAALVAER